jgi:4-hydroxybenzoate polyprenyltransferase
VAPAGPARRPLWKALLVSLRPIQFTKNVLVFVPAVFSVRLTRTWIFDRHVFVSLLITWALLSLLCGATYIINDVVDLERDRGDPDKRKRPLAAGELPPAFALTFALVAIVSVLAVQFGLRDRNVGLGFLGYLGLTLWYSFRLKKVVVVEIMTIATLFVLRTYLGELQIGAPNSVWFACCVGSGALLIAASKRHNEFHRVASGQVSATHARAVLRDYTQEFFLLLLAISAMGALITYTAFALSEGPEGVGLTIPLVVFGVLRFLYLVIVRGAGGSPELLALRDPPLRNAILLWAVLLLAVYYRFGVSLGLSVG